MTLVWGSSSGDCVVILICTKDSGGSTEWRKWRRLKLCDRDNHIATIQSLSWVQESPVQATPMRWIRIRTSALQPGPIWCRSSSPKSGPQDLLYNCHPHQWSWSQDKRCKVCKILSNESYAKGVLLFVCLVLPRCKGKNVTKRGRQIVNFNISFIKNPNFLFLILSKCER